MSKPVTATRSDGLIEVGSEAESLIVRGSFLSPTPVLHSNFLGHKMAYEIIDVSQTDLSVLNSGNAPFLLEHDGQDPEMHIGKVLNAQYDATTDKCVFEAQLSSAECDEGIVKKITTGIRQNVSCMYLILTKQRMADKDGIPVYQTTVKPVEVSSVAFPADSNVGINRAQIIDKEVNLINQEENKMDEEQKAAIAAAVKAEGQRAQSILTECSKRGLDAEFTNALVARGLSLAEVSLDIADEVLKRAAAKAEAPAQAPAAQALTAPVFGQAPAFIQGGKRNFNTVAAVDAAMKRNWKDAGFEREVMQERSIQSQGMFKHDENRVILSRSDSANTTMATVTGQGAEWVDSGFIKPIVSNVYKQTFASKVGVDYMGGLIGNGVIPLDNSSLPDVHILGENRTGPLAASKMATGKLSVSPKVAITKQKYSHQSTVQIPNIVSRALALADEAMAQKVDELLLANTSMSWSGLMNEVPASNIVAAGTNGDVASLALFGKMVAKLIAAKTLTPRAKWLMSGALANDLSTRLKDSANTASGYILNESMDGLIRGYSTIWSQNVASNGAKGTGTALNTAIIGDFRNIIFAEWDYYSIDFDRVTGLDEGDELMYTRQYIDIQCVRDSAFAMCNDIAVA